MKMKSSALFLLIIFLAPSLFSAKAGEPTMKGGETLFMKTESAIAGTKVNVASSFAYELLSNAPGFKKTPAAPVLEQHGSLPRGG